MIKKKYLKKLLLVSIAMIMAMIPMASYATVTDYSGLNRNISLQEQIDPNYQIYQKVLDEINAEYGTDAHFQSYDEWIYSGDRAEIVPLTMSIDDFKTIIINDIIESQKADAEALDAISKLNDVVWYEGTVGEQGDEAEPTRGSYVLYQWKDVIGARIYLNSVVNNNQGPNLWRYSSVTSATWGWIPGTHANPGFVLQSFTYTFLDLHRTAALNCKGYTRNHTTGVIVAQNQTRYVEFYAKSP